MSIPELDAVIDRAIADEVIAGTVVLVARDGEVVHERAAGFADLAEQRPMRVDHLLRYASLTNRSPRSPRWRSSSAARST